jgi:SAM-dependent methyltransferase
VNERRFYEQDGGDDRRSAPAAQRNLAPILDVLREWLPKRGLVLELASGTGEHAAAFSEAMPDLRWQPSDAHPDALRSIAAWRSLGELDNLHDPLLIDAAAAPWPVARADAVVAINMVHISPWAASLGLLAGAARLLGPGAPLILYGPWIESGAPTAESNIAFDADLKNRDADWGLRDVTDFAGEATRHGFDLAERSAMPANNLMLLFRRR